MNFSQYVFLLCVNDLPVSSFQFQNFLRELSHLENIINAEL